ncbi:sugar ABC transporter ATP-binding protein [Stigmatella sp. ncwal1]|uniref:Sugar ABC transporter ATP-binding protein n=1 Tax=Stigmatella ashevillensis TaxID=2995309 RepID=A0ABT5DLW0_9BACT|nr:sugar ABC transporter ATP-binding protein [Stigmatella ashevillena]MDC0713718.1 sugar ABC transporter ATP-binding protein [Stigmatella ashevillena]
MSEAVPVLEMKGISKRFSGVQALRGIDFRLFPGEVHSVMGQNGAGKSTLIKVLTGVHRPDGGRILLQGREIKPKSPLEAQRLGISTVYQEVNLCPNLSIAENICLGHDASDAFAIRWKQMHQKAESLLKDLHVHVDVSAPLFTCSLAVQQVCAIARALNMQAKILILDEPTSSLAEDEVRMLLTVMRRLKAQGMAILFVTHFLGQTFEISDRITILRNGELVSEHPVNGLSRIELINKMVGRELSEEGTSRARSARAPLPPQHTASEGGEPPEAGKPFLRAEALGRRGSVQDVELEVQQGKSLGMGGLLGSGRTELARLLFGIDRAEQGSIEIDGEPARLSSPMEAIQHGLGFCPEDRKHEGIIGELSIRENMVLALQAKSGIFRSISRKRQEELAERYIQALGIKVSDMETPISQLSGGNQQKVLLARWLATHPRMLILDEPTRGIDVAAKAEIMGQVMELCDKGMAILFISSEIDEVLRYSDRIAVMRDRQKVGELETREADEGSVFKIIAGGQA